MRLDVYYFACDFFWLLSSFLLWRVETQHFSHYILQLSSGFPCLSVHRNDSTRKIFFKVWLLIKQGVQELWRSYQNNDVIIFYANQFKKHHKTFLEKSHRINSKHKIQWHYLFLIFFKVIYFKKIWFDLFSYWFSRDQHNTTYVTLLWDIFFSNVLLNQLF